MKQGPGGRNRSRITEWCLLACFMLAQAQPALLHNPGSLAQGVSPPIVGQAIPHESFIKKMSYRFAYRPIWSIFSTEVPFFPDDLSLCQVDKELTSILLDGNISFPSPFKKLNILYFYFLSTAILPGCYSSDLKNHPKVCVLACGKHYSMMVEPSGDET